MADRPSSAGDGALERARNLFRFLKAFAERTIPVHHSLAQHAWTLSLRELPAHPAVTVGEVLVAEPGADAPDEEPPPLLRVRRPKLTRAPDPPSILRDHLASGWERADGTLQVYPARNVLRAGQTVTERFEDDPARVAALEEWQPRWTAWAEAERPALRVMRLFERLYELHGRIERESEQVELTLGDGRLRWKPAGSAEVDHPILLQRVELHFDPNVPEFTVVDAERGPELYAALIPDESGLSPARLNELRAELEQGGYHPLAREATSGYLRRLAQTLGARGTFHESPTARAAGPDPVIVRDAVLLLRTRPTGYPAAFDRVLLDLEARKTLPAALSRLVGVEPSAASEPPEHPASPWGEPPDVLLSKPANAEQVQIARALERHRAVLVQGPPGTGKSHTIANLIGHLVAHGKRVLVTSHATKALRVLRDQVVPELQPLCVAVLESDTEGRTQMEQSVRGILTRITESSEERLRYEVGTLTAERQELNDEITRITAELRIVREAEYTPIVVGGVPTPPAEAARWVVQNAQGNDWIPGPLSNGAPLPLSDEELRELYTTSERISPADEAELAAGIPNADELPTPATFATLSGAVAVEEMPEQAAFWESGATEEEIPRLEELSALARAAAEELARLEPWQRAIVAAGHAGGVEPGLWEELARQVGAAAETWERARPLLFEHDVELPSGLETEEIRRVVGEIGAHVANGGNLGRWTLLTHGKWKTVLSGVRVNGAAPQGAAHFRAVTAHLAVQEARRRLTIRWTRQAVPVGLPPVAELGHDPEPILREYAGHFDDLLAWWPRRWKTIEAAAATTAGLRWADLRRREVARAAPAAPFERDTAILAGPLQDAITSRLRLALRARALRLLREVDEKLAPHGSRVAHALRAAARECDVAAYNTAIEADHALWAKVPAWSRRRELLTRLAASARAWALAVHGREAAHAGPRLPGDPAAAWRWRQLQQEIERRAALDEVALTRRLAQAQDSLRALTARLIDRMAWRAQLGRTDLPARQALQGWADTVRKIGKGTGKRAPALRGEARRLLASARDAVPVWIMPLARVAESFDPAKARFDVVIVDEASQSDVSGLLAWYLGDSIAVVGDHEQVSPLAVGQDTGAVQALIRQHLHGVPNHHLYDGTTSIYDLARQSFGGTIALREHFRCVPDIIEFSNELSYNLEIRPLRDPSPVPRPHVAEFVVQTAERSGKTNHAEARWIAALMKAATELDLYAGKTMGAITLLGDEQAGLIQDVAVSVLGAVELEGRRFVAGNSGQFQGDERHVVFLSMVDTPTGGRLPIRQTQAFQQRYNVAASRARDQLWLVHSLDPARDLQPGDLRRRLIEHVRDPGARRRAQAQAERRAESPFEIAVIQRLLAAGYRVDSQVSVGSYRIDMVVRDGTRQVALECDGDRFHGPAQIPADMARQAVLERAGWRFIRVRGTRFYRDPDRTMAWVLGELGRMGVRPVGQVPDPAPDPAGVWLREQVVRRAWEIMRERSWVEDAAPGAAGADAAVHT